MPWSHWGVPVEIVRFCEHVQALRNRVTTRGLSSHGLSKEDRLRASPKHWGLQTRLIGKEIVKVHRVAAGRGNLALVLVLAFAAATAAGIVHPLSASADPSPSCSPTLCTVSFLPAGSTQSWSVPAGVSSVTVTMAGASGSDSSPGGVGGAGGQVVAALPVVWGETFSVLVGSTAVDGGGGVGGGGVAAAGPGGAGGGGGGGSFVFETFPTSTVLFVTGGGGGAGGDSSEVAGAGGSDGPGSDATTTNADGTVVGRGGTLGAGGAGGAGDQGPSSPGSDGAGPAAAPGDVVGMGGNGGSSDLPSVSSGGGGGGGYYGGGGGGVDTPSAIDAGAGGGGSGFAATSATVVSTGTNTGEGSVTMTYAVPATTTTSGVLRDATTGAPIPNSCVVFSPAAFPGRTNYDSVGGNGQWSFTTSESGPFDLAFYTTANGDCSQPILPTPVPSWYSNQPLTGTDEHVITPPAGATAVAAGTTDVVACLGATTLPTKACAVPPVDLSGTVDTIGPKPLANVCVFVVSADGNGAQTMTDAAGQWSVSGLPANFNVVVAFIPYFLGNRGPCQENGVPPVPATGALQPVFYMNTWINLADPSLGNDPYTWAIAHGAYALTRPKTDVDACITTAAGTVVPRPGCIAAAVTTTTSPSIALDATSLPATGADPRALGMVGTGLLVIGMTVLRLSTRRRSRGLHFSRSSNRH